MSSSNNKIVKTFIDAAILVGIAAGIGWIGKHTLKQKLTDDPSSSIEDFVKFTAVMTGSIYLKDYLVDEKIIPAGY